MDTNEKELAEAVRRIAIVFERRHVRHALIGGLAVGVRSRPRATKDADFIINVPALSFPGLLEELVKEGFEIDVMDLVRRWSAERMIVFQIGKVRIDWLQPVVPLYAHVLNSANSQPWLDTRLTVASAEGLILTKIIAFRPQDQADIVALLAANRDEINVDLVRNEWAPYAATEPERTTWLEAAIKRIVHPRAEG
jgi:hypothetical protein